MQYSDAPARNVPGYWLGDPSSGWRHPFDATFTAWKVWAYLCVPCWLALWLAFPKAALAALLVHRWATWVRRRMPAIVWRRRNWSGVVAGACLALLLAVVTPSLRFWLLPMNWLLATVSAPLLAVLITRSVMRWVTTNTPLSYWLALLPRIAGGPRARRVPTDRVPSFRPGEPLDLNEIERLALTVDPREVIVGSALPRVHPVSFVQWEPADTRAAAFAVAWLSVQKGVRDVRMDDGYHLLFTVSHLGQPEKMTARPGDYVVRDHSGQWRTLPPRAFEADFEVIKR